MVELSALIRADVAELADALDLGSSAARRMGSSPFIRTSQRRQAASLMLSVFICGGFHEYLFPVAAPLVVPDHRAELCPAHRLRHAAADDAMGDAGRAGGRAAACLLHGRLGFVRDGADRRRHGFVLVALRSARHPHAHPGRRPRRRDDGCRHHGRHGPARRPHAAQHDAGRHLSPADWRHRAHAALRPEVHGRHRALGRLPAAARLRARLRLAAGRLDGGLSFHLGLLQCRL